LSYPKGVGRITDLHMLPTGAQLDQDRFFQLNRASADFAQSRGCSTRLERCAGDHNDRMAKLADAYAAAYEGDVQFATSSGQRAYLVQRARRHRKEARVRRATAEELRSHGWR
jgi:hypothetical protein